MELVFFDYRAFSLIMAEKLSLFKSNLFILIITSLISMEDAKYGEPCQVSTNCRDYKTFAFEYYQGESCLDGRCRCEFENDLHYAQTGEAICHSEFIRFGSCLISEKNRTSVFDYFCPADLECLNGKCSCKGGLFMVKKKCYPRTLVRPLERCNVTETSIFACDNFGQNTYCDYGKCQCIKTHYLNFSLSTCASRKSYLYFHKINSYQALPRGYCMSTIDCVEGLRCIANNTCDCPSGCIYKDEYLSCDCGEVELVLPKAVVIIGILLGLSFSICWCYIIKRTIISQFVTIDLGQDNQSHSPQEIGIYCFSGWLLWSGTSAQRVNVKTPLPTVPRWSGGDNINKFKAHVFFIE